MPFAGVFEPRSALPGVIVSASSLIAPLITHASGDDNNAYDYRTIQIDVDHSVKLTRLAMSAPAGS